MERRDVTSEKFSKKGSMLILDNNLQMGSYPRLSDEERVRDFQRKLYRKAKQEAAFRFYLLYDKICLGYVLREAYSRCRKNNGSPGLDNVTFEQIEERGVTEFLDELQQELKAKTYKPSAVKRVYIPKANGKMRPLGIPTIKDRVAQMACKMVIEPIFEADFDDASYGFRPERSAQDAVTKIKEYLQEGNSKILDADLSAYFDTIPHDKLMKLIGMRISDKNVLHLIKIWLKAPVSEDGKISGGKGNKRGTPQGGVISPLLANIYMHLIDRAVQREGGIFQRCGVKIVRYADDFVLIGRTMQREVIQRMKELLLRMELSLNEEKTRIIDMHKDRKGFHFLGFEFRYNKDRMGRPCWYLHIGPSPKSGKKVRDKIHIYLHENGHKPPAVIAKNLNAIICGWINYFTIPKVSYPAKSKRDLRFYLAISLTRFYQRKSQRACKWAKKGAFGILTKSWGLIDPAKYVLPVKA